MRAKNLVWKLDTLIEEVDEKSEQISNALKHLEIADGDDTKGEHELKPLDFGVNGKPSEADENPNSSESEAKKDSKQIRNMLQTDDATSNAPKKHHKTEEKAHINRHGFT